MQHFAGPNRITSDSSRHRCQTCKNRYIQPHKAPHQENNRMPHSLHLKELLIRIPQNGHICLDFASSYLIAIQYTSKQLISDSICSNFLCKFSSFFFPLHFAFSLLHFAFCVLLPFAFYHRVTRMDVSFPNIIYVYRIYLLLDVQFLPISVCRWTMWSRMDSH